MEKAFLLIFKIFRPGLRRGCRKQKLELARDGHWRQRQSTEFPGQPEVQAYKPENGMGEVLGVMAA